MHDVDNPLDQVEDRFEKNLSIIDLSRDLEPTPIQSQSTRTPATSPAHDGFLWPRISTQLDRDGEAVGGTLTLRPEKNVIVEIAL